MFVSVEIYLLETVKRYKSEAFDVSRGTLADNELLYSQNNDYCQHCPSAGIGCCGFLTVAVDPRDSELREVVKCNN